MHHLKKRNRFTNVLIIFIALTLILFGQFPAYAAPKEQQMLPTAEIQLSRTHISPKNLPGSTTVISQEEITRKKHMQVKDFLRETLSMDVIQTGPLGGNTSVFMRGNGSSSTLVMIDGVQVTSNTNGGFNFADLQMDNIEQIEILRGPQSTLWGADAAGGVINIVTKRGGGAPHHFASFEAGSFKTFKETVGSAGEIGDFDYSVAASRTDSGGFSASQDELGNTENDGYENITVSNRAGWNYQDRARVEFVGRWVRSLTQLDIGSDALGNVADGPEIADTEEFNVALPAQGQITPWWHLKFTPSVYYQRAVTLNASFLSNIINRTYTLDLQNNFTLGEYFTAVLGGEYQVQNGYSQASALNKTIDNQGYFFQTTFNYHDTAILTGGVRHDINSQFQDKTTYKVEGAYRIHDTGTRLRAAHGTAFRAPTINDLFFPPFAFFGITFLASNPNLQPQTIKSWEVGVDQEIWGDRVIINMTYFDMDIDNVITPNPTLVFPDPRTFQPQNFGTSTSRGLETGVTVRYLKYWTWNMQHTWNNAFGQNRQQLPRRARHKFATYLNYENGPFQALFGMIWKRGIIDVGSRTTRPYKVARTALAWQATDRLKITVRGENIFNEDYVEVAGGFDTQPASAFIGFQYELN